MEGMLNDLRVDPHHQKFMEHLRRDSVSLGRMGSDDFTVKVLTTGYWPTYTTYDVMLPIEMQKCTQVRWGGRVRPGGRVASQCLRAV
jgi:hypothetical protein